MIMQKRSSFVDSILGHFVHLLDLFLSFGAIYRICYILWQNKVIFLQEVIGLMWIKGKKFQVIWTLCRWVLKGYL